MSGRRAACDERRKERNRMSDMGRRGILKLLGSAPLAAGFAYPAKAKARPELGPGVAFFNSFRDLTASGFWSSKMGVEDLKFMGNTFNPGWNGAPPEVLKKLGLGQE